MQYKHSKINVTLTLKFVSVFLPAPNWSPIYSNPNPIQSSRPNNQVYNQVMHEHKVPTGHQGRDSPSLTGAIRRKQK